MMTVSSRIPASSSAAIASPIWASMVADAGEVGVLEGAGELGADGAGLGNAVAHAQLEGGMEPHRGTALGGVRMLGERDLGGVVEVPVLPRGDEVEMRLLEPEPEEERLVGPLREVVLERGDREEGAVAVDVALVGDVGGLVGGAVEEGAGLLLPVPLDHGDAVGLADLAVLGEGVLAGEEKVRVLLQADRLPGPRGGFANSPVVDLAHGHRLVAVGRELLGEGHDIGEGVPEVGEVLDHARRVRPRPCHDARPRGTADRLLAVGALEEEPVSSEGIEVRADGDGRPVASELGP